MGSFLQDLKLGTRRLLQAPGFTLVVLVLLGLGIGAATALFTVVDGVLLRPLPYPEPDRLVVLQETSTGMPQLSVSYLNFLDYRAQNHTFDTLAVYARENLSLAGRGVPERVRGASASAELFTALGVQPIQGRLYTPQEDQPGAERVALLGEGLWRSRFGGDPGLVGSTLVLDDRPHVVVGILPATFAVPSRVSVWIPVGLRADDKEFRDRSIHPGLQGLGRLKPGVTMAQAQSDLTAIAHDIRAKYPNESTSEGIELQGLHDGIVQDVRTPLLALLAAVGVVLLIACANVASLLLTRAATRRREIAVRSALGASRPRIVQLLFAESVLLALAGGLLGLLLCLFGVDALLGTVLSQVPRADEISVSWSVLAFGVLLSVATGLFFGAAPAREAARVDVTESLREGERGGLGGRRSARFRGALVAAEVALTLVLLAGAGLLLRSFIHVLGTEAGFDPRGVLTLWVTLPEGRYPEGRTLLPFWQRLEERAKGVPGVEAAAATISLPVDDESEGPFEIQGRPVVERSQASWANLNAVGADYFRVLRVPLLKGRTITREDAPTAAPIAVISAGLARQFFPGAEPLGQRLRIGLPDQGLPWMEIVGVVGDVRSYGLDVEMKPAIYLPYAQVPDAWLAAMARSMALAVRTTGDPRTSVNAIRSEVQAIDKDLPVFAVRTMEEILSVSLERRRTAMVLVTGFAAVALLLAVVGLYGVLAEIVAQRRHEIGIRMALGAEGHEVARLVLGQGLRVVALGIGVGLALTLALGRLAASLVFGVSPHDPATLVEATLLLALVALLASLVPLRRATRVDPITTLRCE